MNAFNLKCATVKYEETKQIEEKLLTSKEFIDDMNEVMTDIINYIENRSSVGEYSVRFSYSNIPKHYNKNGTYFCLLKYEVLKLLNDKGYQVFDDIDMFSINNSYIQISWNKEIKNDS